MRTSLFLVDIARKHAQEFPGERAFVFLSTDGTEEQTVTWAELDARARAVSGWLQRYGYSGGRVLLLLPTGIDFVTTFLGCLYAGAAAVPAPAPRQRVSTVERYNAILEDAGAQCVITTASLRDRLRGEMPAVRVESPDAIWQSCAEFWTRPQFKPEDLAFLQYTSGSTGTPRGVAVTHRNIWENEGVIQRSFEVTSASVICAWLPLYHDMGLVGCMLQPIYSRAACILTPPAAFMQRPARWLQTISEYRATISGAPNFAYDQCVQRVTDRDLQGLDLSTWEVAFNGAEPVRAATLRAFEERFHPAGFRRSAWRPCYGLAESTLFVSTASTAQTVPVDSEALQHGLAISARPEKPSVELVSCGQAQNSRVVAVDVETLRARADGEVGELWLQSPSVAAGYWGKPEETKSTFLAELPGDSGMWLRTGDLGFLSGGEIFVTGRCKDLIILEGRNYYPQDLEDTVQQCHPALRFMACAALTIEVDGRERLAIVCEADERHKATDAEIYAHVQDGVSRQHEQEVWAVGLTSRGSVPRTTSGKIRRSACRALLNGDRTFWKGQTLREDIDARGENLNLPREIARILKVQVEDVQADTPLTRLGLDSIRSVEIANAIERHRGVRIDPADLLDGKTVSQVLTDAEALIPIRPDVAETPLTAFQEQLYFAYLADPGDASNHIASASEIQGLVDTNRLQRALDKLANAHQVLRTRIVMRDGSPYQIVQSASAVPLRLIHTSPDELESAMRSSAAAPFDLGTLPPIRADLFRLEPKRHVLLVTVHHIVADLRSMTLLFEDLLALLSEDGTTSSARATWSQFVEWQRAWMSTAEGHETSRSQEARPTGRAVQFPSPPQTSDQAIRNLGAPLAADLKEKVHGLAKDLGTTPFSIYSAAFGMLLSRYSGEDQIVFGAPVSGRPDAFNSTVGCFVTIQPLRANCRPERTCSDLIRSINLDIVSSLRHCYIPLSSAKQQPLNAVLAFQSNHGERLGSLMPFIMGMPGGSVSAGDVCFTSMQMDLGEPSHDLVVTLGETDRQILMRVQARHGVLSESLLRAILPSFALLLRQMTDAPDRQIESLRLTERTALPHVQSRVAHTPQLIHEWFQQAADRHASRVAVTAGGVEITYSALNARANRMARVLRRRGCGPERLVAIRLDRGIDMVTAILAVLKTGGGYVPLDSADSSQRIAHILRTSGCTLAITTAELAASTDLCGLEVLHIDEANDATDAEAEDNLHQAVDPDNTAYVIYTSGSTGEPKGCVVTHRNVTGLFASTEVLCSFSEHDVSTVFHSFAFDFSVWELWSALLYGGRAAIVPWRISRSPEQFIDLLREERVTCVSQTPTAFRELLTRWRSLPDLRLVVFGGEELPFSMLREWFDRAEPLPVLVNMYGITETTVHVTWREITRPDTVSEHAPSRIGLALPDLRLYVLDEQMQVVPAGVIGELYVGGRGLARGYLNAPALTAQRYLPNPFSERAGERLYRSGDLGRYDENGDVEYIGRKDRQVQIRGFRVEPGEIEACLESCSGVSRAVVVSRREERTETTFRATHAEPYGFRTRTRRHYVKESFVRSAAQSSSVYLVAYVCFSGEAVPHDRLESHLRERLPAHMIPSVIMPIEQSPITDTGKLDRSRLPAPATRRLDESLDYQPPRSAIEMQLGAIWREVLDIERIGVKDSFFGLGGDSIRAIRLAGKAEARGLPLSVADIFKYPTIEALAERCSTSLPETYANEIRPFAMVHPADLDRMPEGIVDMYPLSRMQAGLLFHSDQHANSSVYRASFLYRMRGALSDEALRNAISEACARHPILRTSFDLTRYREPMQLVHAMISLPVRFVDLSSLPADQLDQSIEQWFEDERTADFDVRRAPLFRFTIHRLTAGEFTLGLTCHDAILDGWSTSSLLAEVLTRAARVSACDSKGCGPPAITYAHFVHAEHEALHTQGAAEYWERETADWTHLRVPGRRAKTENSRPEMAVLDVEISRDLSDRLVETARREELPLKNVLLAVHMRVLQAISGLEDVSTGLEVNGRLETAGGEECLGQHLNTVPFRLRLSGGTWLHLAQETLAAEREMLPHRRLPYAEIQKRFASGPLYETTFNYTHFHVFEDVGNLENVEVVSGTGRELTHYVLKTEFNRDAFTGRLHLDVIYDSTELPADQTLRIGHLYIRALAAMAYTPSARYEESELLDPEERDCVLRKFNAPYVELPEHTLHELIAMSAAAGPDSPAVVFAGETLTYRELSARANQLALRLKQAGLERDGFAGVYLERSIHLIPALLAVLKAGGAFVPIDAELPEERVRYILRDSGVKLVLTHSALTPCLPDGLTALAVDEEGGVCQTTGICDTPVAPDNAAYMIYTSGSTGNPKGAINTRSGIVNRLRWMQKAYGFGPEDRVLQKTPVSFDVSVWELFLPLLCGGCVIVARPGGHREPEYLAQIIREQQVTALHFVPSMLREFLNQPLPEFPTLKRVICSGEELTTDLATLFRQRLPAELHNLYGPTEAAVDVSAWQFTPEDCSSPGVPIGRPIWNTQLFILNNGMQPCAIGTPGELYIGGTPLARGYHGRPSLTAERFIPNPYGAPGTRLYRTGDLVVWREDGAIVFLGRIDAQVKINGVRIEPAEIESALQQHPNVRDCAVAAKERAGKKQLVAWIVPRDEAAFDAADLRAWAANRLPSPMVPARFLSIEALPFTSSGKLDRRRLRDLDEHPDTRITELLRVIETLSPAEAQAQLAALG